MTPLLSEARLARQAGEGDQRAFTAIYKRYHQGIYRFCLSILGRPEDAQDALQNTMVKALRALPGERREIQLKPWLYRVAHNESIDLLRKRREGPQLDDTQESVGPEIAQTVAVRERLGRLLSDLADLPERQRSALVMRELGGLEYEQIGEAFESTPAVARQTVYEARINLRDLEAGREMSCDEITRQLSEADGRVTRRRDIRAHLRACPDCRAFRDAIGSRRRDLAALAPLPAVAATSILHAVAGGKAALGGGLGGMATTAGVGAGKVAGTSALVKTVATVAVVATVGVTAADRGGLIDAGLPGGTSDRATPAAPAQGGGDPAAGQAEGSTASSHGREASGAGGDGSTSGQHQSNRRHSAGKTNASQDGRQAAGKSPGSHGNGAAGNPAALPEASRHGQETAAANKANGTDNPGQSRPHSTTPGSTRSNHGGGSGGRHGGPRQANHSERGKGSNADKNQPAPPKPAAPKNPPPAPSQPEAKPDGKALPAPDAETAAGADASP